MHAWFQPSSIATGYESDSSGILWEPKVWIDDVNRLIYVIDQNSREQDIQPDEQ
jgi:hypothetical protein